MTRVDYGALLAIGFVAGLFLGIQVKTGVDVEPNSVAADITKNLTQAMAEEAPAQSKGLFTSYNAVIALMLLLDAIISIASIMLTGWWGITTAGLGFGGAFLIILDVPLGVGLLIIGGIISWVAKNYPTG